MIVSVECVGRFNENDGKCTQTSITEIISCFLLGF